MNTSNKAELINAVSGGLQHSLGINQNQGTILGEGNLQVTKKAREVVYSTGKIIDQSPSKCSITGHYSKIPEKDREEEEEDEELSASSSIKDAVQTPVTNEVCCILFPSGLNLNK